MPLIVRMSGGLGNQMFQYAFYEALASRGKDVYVDLSWYKNFQCHNNFELDKIFSVSFKEATSEMCEELGEDRYDIFHRIMLRLFPKKTYYQQKWLNALCFDAKVLDYDDFYLAGYFQSEKYFLPIQNLIRERYIFDERKMPRLIKKYAEDMVNENSVSIHVRRGDYLKYKEYQGICDDVYYKAAINYMKDNVVNPVFYVFSNDIKWCRNKWGDSVKYIDENTGLNSFWDMFLMTKCKHNIIANSSFSWWGAWLGENDASIVVAPSKWLNIDANRQLDIVPERWIKL